MKLKLSENPKDWKTFGWALALLLSGGGFILQRKGVWPGSPWISAAVGIILATLVAWRPAVVRPIYRVAMKITFPIGQVIGCILLALFFVMVITPMGLVLRLAGKDLLRMRRRNSGSYWLPSRKEGAFERMF